MRDACLDCGLRGLCSWGVGCCSGQTGPPSWEWRPRARKPSGLPSLPFLTPSRPKAVTPSPLLRNNPLAPPPSQPF